MDILHISRKTARQTKIHVKMSSITLEVDDKPLPADDARETSPPCDPPLASTRDVIGLHQLDSRAIGAFSTCTYVK